MIASAIFLMVALTVLVRRSRFGKALRATAFDGEAAAMMGIDIDKVIVFAIQAPFTGVRGHLSVLVRDGHGRW